MAYYNRYISKKPSVNKDNSAYFDSTIKLDPVIPTKVDPVKKAIKRAIRKQIEKAVKEVWGVISYKPLKRLLSKRRKVKN